MPRSNRRIACGFVIAGLGLLAILCPLFIMAELELISTLGIGAVGGSCLTVGIEQVKTGLDESKE